MEYKKKKKKMKFQVFTCLLKFGGEYFVIKFQIG